MKGEQLALIELETYFKTWNIATVDQHSKGLDKNFDLDKDLSFESQHPCHAASNGRLRHCA